MTIAFIKLIPMLHRLHSASHYKVKRNKVVIEEIDIIDITIEVSLLDFIVGFSPLPFVFSSIVRYCYTFD